MSESNLTQQPWFLDPFGWYEEAEYQHVVSMQISDTKALDILRGLYDIYKNLMRNDMQEAIDDLKAMAVIIIAHTLGYSDEVVEELLVMKAKDELDDFLQEILEEGK
jgi:hypothetical protein